MPEPRQCPECGATLGPDAPDGACPVCALRGALDLSDACVQAVATEKPGDRIGRYKLLERIGEGGYGFVYMAEQAEPIRRRVALKIVKLGMDTKQVIGRFEAERQALALMDHPNIAKVLDAGATDTGRPYFVMELVRGTKITDYCDQNNLSAKERLDLFMQVCHAIQHAHQKGIIHRDLKPSNILVTLHDGVPVPKVIDFGIAKATGQPLTEKTLYTAFTQFIGTPAYMSPEQAEMSGLDIDTRSDIYSLGVLLYELLTGHTPFEAKTLLEAGMDEMRRLIREKEPPRPSTKLSTLAAAELTAVAKQRDAEPPKLISLVRGDLDWIVMKCLEKDRRRRYETANGLAQDIERHLNSEPVTAAAPGAIYRLRKFVRRHRYGIATATAILLLLIAGVIVSTWQAVRATRAKRAANLAGQAEAQQRRRAEASAREIRDRLVRARVASGVRLLDEGDYFSALPWFVDALRLDENNPLGELEHRIRIASVLRWCPTLLRLWVPGGTDAYGTFNEDGSWVAVSGEEDTVRVWSVEGGQAVSPVIAHGEKIPKCSVLFQFRPGRKQLLTFSELGQWAKLWDVESGEMLGQFTQPCLRTCSFSKDGSLLAAGSNDGVLTVWDLSSGNVLFSNLVHRGYINSLDFSPDNKRLITSSYDHDTKIWTTDRGEQVLCVSHANGIFHVEFDAHGRRFLTACFDKTARVWDATNGTPLTPPLTHKAYLWQAHFSPGDRYVVTCSADQTAKIWDATTGIEMAEPLEHERKEVVDCAFSPDGKLVATCGSGGLVRVWLLPQGKLVWPPLVHTRAVNHVAFHPDGRRLLTVGSDGQVRLWDLMPRDGLVDPPALQGMKLTKASQTGDLLLAETTNNEVRLVDTLTWQPTGVQIKESGSIEDRFLSADNRQLLTLTVRTIKGDQEARLDLWDSATGKRLTSVTLPELPVSQICVSSDLQFIAWATDRVIHVFNTATGRRVGKVLGTGDQIDRLALSPDGSQVAVASHDPRVAWWRSPRMVTVWNLTARQPSFPPLKHPDAISCVAFSPDGQWLVTACSGRTPQWGGDAYVWDTSTGRSASLLLQHAHGVHRAAFSPDSRLLLTGGEDGIARVWHFLAGKAASPHLTLPSYIVGAAFGHSNRWIAASCFNHWTTNSFTRVWSVAHGEPLTLLLPCPGDHVGQIQFIANCRYLYACDPYREDYAKPGRKVRQIWDLTADTRPAEDLQALAHLLSGCRLDATGVTEPMELSVLAQTWADVKRRYPEQFASPANTSHFWPASIHHWTESIQP